MANSEKLTAKAPWNLEDDRFLVGFGLFSGAFFAVSLRECSDFGNHHQIWFDVANIDVW